MVPEKTIISCHIAGMKHHPGLAYIKNLTLGQILRLDPEVGNKFDDYAVRILAPLPDTGYIMLGYVPADFSRIVNVLIANNVKIECAVNAFYKNNYNPVGIIISLV
jgi:hypothetical protein